MVVHICKICNFSSTYKGNYDIHLTSIKHKNNYKLQNKIINTNTVDNSGKILITIVNNQNSLAKQNEELRQKIELLEKSNQELKNVNNQNTNKIVKEARIIKKSILTILNTNFKDNPSINYINEKDFILELELEYNRKINDRENGLFLRIFSDFERNKLIHTISKLILKFIKKKDQTSQSVFNIDSSRGNYATKIEKIWHNDKSGLQLKTYTLDMVIKYMLNVLEIFRQRLEILIKNRNKTNDERDYVMKYQDLFLDVRAFLTNSNIHKKIILYMCPELRIDEKMLE
jgi:hypothetical protein